MLFATPTLKPDSPWSTRTIFSGQQKDNRPHQTLAVVLPSPAETGTGLPVPGNRPGAVDRSWPCAAGNRPDPNGSRGLTGVSQAPGRPAVNTPGRADSDWCEQRAETLQKVRTASRGSRARPARAGPSLRRIQRMGILVQSPRGRESRHPAPGSDSEPWPRISSPNEPCHGPGQRLQHIATDSDSALGQSSQTHLGIRVSFRRRERPEP